MLRAMMGNKTWKIVVAGSSNMLGIGVYLNDVRLGYLNDGSITIIYRKDDILGFSPLFNNMTGIEIDGVKIPVMTCVMSSFKVTKKINEIIVYANTYHRSCP